MHLPKVRNMTPYYLHIYIYSIYIKNNIHLPPFAADIRQYRHRETCNLHSNGTCIFFIIFFEKKYLVEYHRSSCALEYEDINVM